MDRRTFEISLAGLVGGAVLIVVGLSGVGVPVMVGSVVYAAWKSTRV